VFAVDPPVPHRLRFACYCLVSQIISRAERFDNDENDDDNSQMDVMTLTGAFCLCGLCRSYTCSLAHFGVSASRLRYSAVRRGLVTLWLVRGFSLWTRALSIWLGLAVAD
jgi:hypothetical protein